MTDNEKAATFIGWEPGQKVRGQGDLPWRHSYVNRSAPDMSKPENYMRAVAVLMAQGRTVCFSPRWIIVHDEHGTNLAEADTQRDIGSAVAKALAALYNAEHPKDA